MSAMPDMQAVFSIAVHDVMIIRGAGHCRFFKVIRMDYVAFVLSMLHIVWNKAQTIKPNSNQRK